PHRPAAIPYTTLFRSHNAWGSCGDYASSTNVCPNQEFLRVHAESHIVRPTAWNEHRAHQLWTPRRRREDANNRELFSTNLDHVRDRKSTRLNSSHVKI